METYFGADELNDEGRMWADLEKMEETPHVAELKRQTRIRSPFVYKDDEKYIKFWKTYGETTEMAAGLDRELPFPVYQLAILDPADELGQQGLKVKNPNETGELQYLEFDQDGMAVAVTDIFGKTTRRRVCPECHNPLPLLYGKNPVKFISVIGVTGAGKTVYISQLLKHMSKYSAYAKLVPNFTSNHESNFIEQNPVERDKPLPNATMRGQLSQPLFYDILQVNAWGRKTTNTIVIYDIAGEDCIDTTAMDNKMRFVEKADGIILLIDPSQLELTQETLERSAEPDLVLQTIHTSFVASNSGKNEKYNKPVAVCVSKSDKFADNLELVMQDISPVIDENSGENLPLFNATDYNVLEPQIKALMNDALKVRLETEYSNFNYFVFSATGCPVEERMDERGRRRSFLAGPPFPKRIAEPLLWMFHQFGYIKSDIPVRLPVKRPEYRVRREEIRKGFLGLGRKKVTVESEMTPEQKEQLWYEEPKYSERKF
ncbi:MAG: hypothetical protein Q4E24_01670 [bacterium]|nr:hypothetical protein [bacterium]